MEFRRIKIHNFKSFGSIDVFLDRFSAIIGSNASGKSNFVHVFRFIRDIASYGLDNAISMQGGIHYLSNLSIGKAKDLYFELHISPDTRFSVNHDERLIGVEFQEVIYRFQLRLLEGKPEYEVSEDTVQVNCDFFALEADNDEIIDSKFLNSGIFILENCDGELNPSFDIPESVPVGESEFIPPFFDRVPADTLLLESPMFPLLLRHPQPFFEGITIYDFDPKQPKKAVPMTGKTELNEDGSNLAIVLSKILENEDQNNKMLNLLHDVLSFVDDIDVARFVDKSLLLTLREDFESNEYLPASFLSDGTIHLISLLISLYFENKPFIIIEEPERNIHPFLISRVVEMIQDAAENKQIIITTHNPEFVKAAGVDNLLLIARDSDGFSNITRPRDNAEVRIFMENQLGIDDLFVQNLLTA